MARPRRDEQDVILGRIEAALASREELHPWTLADISSAAGLSPAGLIKRFGSRGGILQALSRRWIDSIPPGPRGEVAPEEEMRAWVGQRFVSAGPHALAVGLVNLLDDLVDPALRDLLADGWTKEIAYLNGLLTVMGIGSPERRAPVLFDALNGAMLRAAASGAEAPPRTLDRLLEEWT